MNRSHEHPGQEEPRSYGQTHHESRRIDLNAASLEELADLPMIGHERAQALCRARPFGSWDDVEKLPGFSKGIVDDLRSGLEAAILHFRGAYHNPAMYVPVTVPPTAAVLMVATATRAVNHRNLLVRVWMRITVLAGLLGSAYHTIGVHRNMGGWRNWNQNLLNGPPIPAPPAFTGLALAGLAAIGLLRDHADG